MNEVNKTLYIPLYGKAYVSRKGLFLHDAKAEQIWQQEGFALTGKAKSKWLAYYMGIRSAVFDDWLVRQLLDAKPDLVLHLGCGMDSRAHRLQLARIRTGECPWYDVDFPKVIRERQRYYEETDSCKMLGADLRSPDWSAQLPAAKHVAVVMEGVSMYLSARQLQQLLGGLCGRFGQVTLLMDCYTTRAARASKYKNPVNTVGVTQVYGIDDPRQAETAGLTFVREHEMTPAVYVDRLQGVEKLIFKSLFAGRFAGSLYRLYEYRKG